MLPSFGCCTFDFTDDAPSTVHVVRDLLTAYEEVATLVVGGPRAGMRAGGSALCLRYAGHGNKQSPVGIYILTALFLGG